MPLSACSRRSTVNSSTYLHRILNQSATLNGTPFDPSHPQTKLQYGTHTRQKERERERDRERHTSSLQRRSVQPSLAIALESSILQERNCGCVHISPSSVPILAPVCKDSFACAHYVCCRATGEHTRAPHERRSSVDVPASLSDMTLHRWCIRWYPADAESVQVRTLNAQACRTAFRNLKTHTLF